jgi:hypothetical protein
LRVCIAVFNIEISSRVLQVSEKSKKLVIRSKNGKCTFDQVKHFPINIVPHRAHPFNLIRIDIIGISQNGQESRIGGVLFHVHDIIKGAPLSRDFAVAGIHLIVGRINLEITFNYGAFGYGMDRQVIH